MGNRDRRCANSPRSTGDGKLFTWLAIYDGECVG